MKNIRKQILWITRTAIFIALLIVVQIATKPLGQLVTGSLVNLILIVSVITCGLSSGLTVAVISPVIATLVGIGPPFWVLTPFIILGNGTIALIWHFVGNRIFHKKYVVISPLLQPERSVNSSFYISALSGWRFHSFWTSTKSRPASSQHRSRSRNCLRP
jgi:hypothetical protein